MAEFTNKVVIVTGASEGIGRAICLGLAPQAPKLVLAARNMPRLEALAGELETLGAEALPVPTDVSREDGCKALVDTTVQAFGRIDALVNNAGRTMWSLFEDITDLSLFEQLMRVNYLSCVYCTHHALPHLKQTRGRVVGVSSVAGLTGVPTRTGYCATKHAMFGFFNALRIELLGTGVTVTMAAPDFVLSEVHRRAFGPDGKPLDKSPMQEDRIMTAEECAGLIIDAMTRRRRLLITSRRGKIGRFLALFAPGLLDRIAARAIQRKR